MAARSARAVETGDVALRKFVEIGGGRIGYAMTEAALSEVSGGAKWNPDASFSVADALLADPEFVGREERRFQAGTS